MTNLVHMLLVNKNIKRMNADEFLNKIFFGRQTSISVQTLVNVNKLLNVDLQIIKYG